LSNQWLYLEKVDVYKNQTKVLDNISIELRIGENITILGPNGSGKSSFIELINRSIYPIFKKNSVLQIFKSTDINIWDLRKKVGLVNTDIQKRVSRKMLVFDIVMSGFYGSIGLHSDSKIYSKHIESVNITLNRMSLYEEKNKTYGELSDGQKRRVLIARSLINNPRILILDEPMIGLDLKSHYELIEILEKISEQGTTLLISTNKLENILTTTQKIICFKKGKIIKSGSPSEILKANLISSLFDTQVEVISANGYWRTVPIKDRKSSMSDQRKYYD